MREIKTDTIIDAIRKMCIEANCIIPDEVIALLKKSLEIEETSIGKEIIQQILENNRIAREQMVPICQDTGTAVVFVELGHEVVISGGFLYDAINEGIRRGYKDGYLRKSIVSDPLNRKNTNDNTPAAIHLEMVPGDKVKITLLPKGGGSENMGALKMLPPSAGLEGVKLFVIEAIQKAGANPCPPIIVGVGIGGNFDGVTLLSKKAHLRPAGRPHPEPFYAGLEQELLKEINNTGIGPQGLGGRCTALAVHIEYGPCHITALPVAVNINCHAARVREVIL
ncbi:MAG: fumarate hydratase [Planctomycetota bacterium]|nr:fumarate hydratase [Planctomycetota bacterium]MDI6786798.1 fumarate hydratase [Planctomycetota bacterium]